jgi:periplasmic divalent cation tolerance protein
MAKVIVFSTCASKSEARRIASELLKRRLVACVNIFPISSFYWWKSKIRIGSELLLIMKTRAELVSKLQATISTLHSYEVPEVVSVKIDSGLPAYLRWIESETNAKTYRMNSKRR